jgi:hypothetical protein
MRLASRCFLIKNLILFPMSLEQELAKQPIILPGSPFWEVFKHFGRDEAIAGVTNVIGTAAMTAGLGHVAWDPAWEQRILAITGPVIEKIGFFIGNGTDAYELYKTTPQERRDSFWHYAGYAAKRGGASLAKDVAFHDPLYAVSMLYALQKYPEVPAWMVAAASFLGAVIAVAAGEVAFDELRYKAVKRNLSREGFSKDEYYESRFFIRPDQEPAAVLDRLAGRFQLPICMSVRYRDVYFKSTLPQYSGRSSHVRLRDRVMADGSHKPSAQITFSRTAEMPTEDQYRYYPHKKEKFYFGLAQPAHSIGELPSGLRAFLGKKAGEQLADISFERTLAYHPDHLLVAMDVVKMPEPFYVVEVKVRKDAQRLKEAMRYVMTEFPVIQTTYRKVELSQLH